MKNTIRRLIAIAVLCALCLCLLAGCGAETPDTDSTTTVDGATTTTDSATTTVDEATTTAKSTKPTKSTTSQKSSTSAQTKSSQSVTSTSSSAAADTPAPIASVSGIQIDGTALSGFDSSTTNYVHYLPTGTTAIPKVTAAKTGGTGELAITQATSVSGAAKVSLNDVTYTIQFVVKRAESDILNNTYYQLKTANKLNIAYLGGSVTDGFSFDDSCTSNDSWRAQTTNWFKSQYPSAKITETNAGIGGTGSMYGAYRVIRDLKLQSATEKPDLVFVEFAVNDQYDTYVNTTPDVYMESIVRTIYQYAPQADIVMVFVTNSTTKDTEFTAKAAHKKIADVYQIPYIDVGARLWKEMVAENGGSAPSSSSAVWTKYFSDSVHPAKAGYQKYAQYVQEYLSGVLSKKTTAPSSLKNAQMPSASFTKLPVSPYITNLKGETAVSGMTVTGDGYLVTKQGGTFTIKFTGTDLYAWIYGQSTSEDAAGYFRIYIDGVRQKGTIPLTGNNHKILPLATGLSNGEHTVKIQVSAPSTGSVNLDLRYFLISGDSQMRGITLVN